MSCHPRYHQLCCFAVSNIYCIIGSPFNIFTNHSSKNVTFIFVYFCLPFCQAKYRLRQTRWLSRARIELYMWARLSHLVWCNLYSLAIARVPLLRIWWPNLLLSGQQNKSMECSFIVHYGITIFSACTAADLWHNFRDACWGMHHLK